MLGKLLKYEIPVMGRKLGPLFLAWFAASLLLGLSIGGLNGTGFFEILSPLIYGMVTTAVFVMFVILIIQRYSSSLLGDEAYFNLTLPVSTNAHIANKALSALVWTVITGFAALVSVFIIGIASGGMKDFFSDEGWKEFLTALSQMNGSAILVILEMLVVTAFSIVKSILAIYAAITIGHQASQRTTLASIGAYIGLMIAESMLGNMFIQLGIITEVNMSLSETLSDMGLFHLIMLVGLVVSLALSAAYFFICKYLMEKHLNLA